MTMTVAERPMVLAADMVTTRMKLPCDACVHDLAPVCIIKANVLEHQLDIVLPRAVDERVHFLIKAEAVCDSFMSLDLLEPRTYVAPLSRIDKVRLNLGIVGLVSILGTLAGYALMRLGAFHL